MMLRARRRPVLTGQTVAAPGIDSAVYTANTGRGQYLWYDDWNTETVPAGANIPSIDGYRRFKWSEIESTQGDYTAGIALIASHAAAAAARGGRCSLLVMPVCEYGVESGLSDAMPAYVSSACNAWNVVAADNPTETLRVPDWNNETFLTRWTAMMTALGVAFNADERILFVGIGGYGNWGEWHNYPYESAYQTSGTNGAGGRLEITVANAQRIVNAAASAFPAKGLVLNPPGAMLNPTTGTARTYEKGSQIIKHAMSVSRKIGWHLGSLGHVDIMAGVGDIMTDATTYCASQGLSGVDLPWNRWQVAGCFGEFNPGTGPASAPTASFSNALSGQSLTHTCFIPNAGYVGGPAGFASFPSDERDAHLAMSRTAGFVLRVADIRVPSRAQRGGRASVFVRIQNDGCAPTYDRWAVSVRLHDSAGGVISAAPLGLAMSSILPGAPQAAVAQIPIPSSAQPGIRTISIRAINGSCSYAAPLYMQHAGRQADGGYPLTTITL